MSNPIVNPLFNPLVLEAHQLCKTYHDGKLSVEVLTDIELSISAGERLAIMGSSGSGKSTLLHLLGGLDNPSQGNVQLMGQDFSDQVESKRSALRNRYLGFVYQFHHLLPEFTVLDNVAMPLLIRRTNMVEARKQAMHLLDLVGLSHRLHHKPMELSGGERQRTAIARALVTKPACLLADEPTGNLDSANAENIYQLMLDLQKETAMAMVIVTHDLALAQTMPKVLYMKDGRFMH
jgi:lipoprotein-releasing system ATP-binding protein